MTAYDDLYEYAADLIIYDLSSDSERTHGFEAEMQHECFEREYIEFLSLDDFIQILSILVDAGLLDAVEDQYAPTYYSVPTEGFNYVRTQRSHHESTIYKYNKFGEGWAYSALKNIKARLPDPFAGIGQVDVTWFGRKLVIGCEVGEEERTKNLVAEIEIAAGQVPQALESEIDPFRTLLMGSLLVAGDYKEQNQIPASDREVTRQDNIEAFDEAAKSLDFFVEEFKSDHRLENIIGDEKPVFERIFEAARQLFRNTRINVSLGYSAVVQPIQNFIRRYEKEIVSGSVIELAKTAVAYITKLLAGVGL